MNNINLNRNLYIVDCFLFYNELDMLLYRLEILNDYIDYFILIESKYTHSGKEKPLYYNNIINTDQSLFKKYENKIIHLILNDMPYKYPNIDYSKNQQWINENFQRNSIDIGLSKIILNNKDIILLSDIDEIPDINLLNSIKNNFIKINDIYSLEQDFYYYNLNSKIKYKWYDSKIFSYKIYKELNKGLNDIRISKCKIINNGGWHLSYFGDKYFIKNKIENFSHQEYNNNNYTDLNKIENKILNQIDLYDRNDTDILHLCTFKTPTF